MRVNRDSAALGRGFERRVSCAFEGNGYVAVARNRWMRNYDVWSDSASKREFDLVFFRPRDFQFYIVECKAHFSKDALVSLDDVALFHAKLLNYRGFHAVPVLATDTSVTRPALDFLKKSNIYLLDGEGLGVFEEKASVVKRVKSKVYSFAFSSVDRRVDSLIRSYF